MPRIIFVSVGCSIPHLHAKTGFGSFSGSGLDSGSDSENICFFLCLICLSILPSEESTMSTENVPATNTLRELVRLFDLTDHSRGT